MDISFLSGLFSNFQLTQALTGTGDVEQCDPSSSFKPCFQQDSVDSYSYTGIGPCLVMSASVFLFFSCFCLQKMRTSYVKNDGLSLIENGPDTPGNSKADPDVVSLRYISKLKDLQGENETEGWGSSSVSSSLSIESSAKSSAVDPRLMLSEVLGGKDHKNRIAKLHEKAEKLRGSVYAKDGESVRKNYSDYVGDQKNAKDFKQLLKCTEEIASCDSTERKATLIRLRAATLAALLARVHEWDIKETMDRKSFLTSYVKLEVDTHPFCWKNEEHNLVYYEVSDQNLLNIFLDIQERFKNNDLEPNCYLSLDGKKEVIGDQQIIQEYLDLLDS